MNESTYELVHVHKLQMYFAAKILAEKAGWEATNNKSKNNIDFISIIQTPASYYFLL